MSIQDQIALLRGAVAVPDDTELLKAYSRANKGQQLIGAERATFLRHVRIALAATPPAYAEALSAVLDGFEAMQADHQLALMRARRDQTQHLVELAQDLDLPISVIQWLRAEAGRMIDADFSALAKLGEKA